VEDKLIILEVLYEDNTSILAPQAVENAIADICGSCGYFLLKEGIRDGVDGGYECFDIYLIREPPSRWELLYKITSVKGVKAVVDREVKWVDIVSVSEKVGMLRR